MSRPQINVMFALGRLPGCGHAGLRQGSGAAICTKMQHYGRGLARTRVGGAGYKIQDVVGGQGTAVAIYPGFSFYINLQYFMFISPIVPNINASCAIML